MQTPLHSHHESLAARMIPFAGWTLPVQYKGIIPEHQHTRRHASLFDTCHMSEFRVRGSNAKTRLSAALACRIRNLQPGRCRYGFILREDGGILDDLICYCIDNDEFFIVSNAGTREKVSMTLRSRLPDIEVTDISSDTAKLDIQGPQACAALAGLAPDIREIGYFRFLRTDIAGTRAIVSRTGYTGELGYEVYSNASHATELWEKLLSLPGVEPAGLGARDTLRLEMGYPLYGQDLSESVTPVEAGLEAFLPRDEQYVGMHRVQDQLASGVRRMLVGIRLEGRSSARPGSAVYINHTRVGEVTSGSFTPSLGCAISLGYVEAEHAHPDTRLELAVRSRRLEGVVEPLPFYHDGTVRADTSIKETERGSPEGSEVHQRA